MRRSGAPRWSIQHGAKETEPQAAVDKKPALCCMDPYPVHLHRCSIILSNASYRSFFISHHLVVESPALIDILCPLCEVMETVLLSCCYPSSLCLISTVFSTRCTFSSLSIDVEGTCDLLYMRPMHVSSMQCDAHPCRWIHQALRHCTVAVSSIRGASFFSIRSSSIHPSIEVFNPSLLLLQIEFLCVVPHAMFDGLSPSRACMGCA